jgi:outer membrane protein insertion porin family
MALKFAGTVGAAFLVLAIFAAPTAAQTSPTQAPAPPAQPPVGGMKPALTPPPDSGPMLRIIELRFEPVNESLIEPQTYLYYIQTRSSRPSDGVWVPFNEETERSLLEDFKRLWATNFLDNLRIEVLDRDFDGVAGKHIIFHMEERPRVKIVEYMPADAVDRTKVDEKMKEAGVALRLDSFLDQGAIRRVEGILRSLMSEKGHQFAEVKSRVEELPGGPKLAKVIFDINEGPKVKVRDIEFVGNDKISDGTLKRRMKETKEHWFLSFITGRGTYQEEKFEEDADKVQEFYREQGYIQARVGTPEIKTLEDSEDKETRWVQLRIPVTEGHRYRVGEVTFEGNKVVDGKFLQPLFKLKPGEWYSEKDVRKGFEKARELYGGAGYFEFTGFPDMAFQDPGEGPIAGPADPTVNITMRLTEGEQYFVNRITFTGNNTTRDNVIRREMRLVEGGVFSTEQLKYSIRRLNQLGYFQNLEQSPNAVDVQKTPDSKNEVDVTLKLEEQNRNQLTFGAGVSQYEGIFGQLSFQTSNFLGRGESLTLSLQAGSRAEQYQLAFTEPFLFDRNITGGIDIFKRKLEYVNQFTQKSTGGNILFGFPVADFSRLFLTYSYESTRVSDFNEAFFDPNCFFREGGCREISLDDLSELSPDALELLRRNPFLQDSLLIGQGGERTISKVVPSFVFNTIDNPIFPNTGRRLSVSSDFAGLGGNTNFIKPRVEGVAFFRHTSRTSFGFRGQLEYVRAYGSTQVLPIFERLFLGGEYSIRGFDIRSIGPRDPNTNFVLGGNKSLLFNAEYLITIANPVRVILFFDAGQVRNNGQNFAWKENILDIVPPPAPLLFDPFATTRLTVPGQPTQNEVVVTGQTYAFKVSTGAEVRFFMPVLNVPFRLIFAHNPSRVNVLDTSNFQPAKAFTFRFAVGTTF